MSIEFIIGSSLTEQIEKNKNMSGTMMRFFKFMHCRQLEDIDSNDENGETALHLLVKGEKFTQEEVIVILEKLINADVDVNIKNVKNETILHLAIAKRMKDIVEFLITQNFKLDHLIAEYVIKDEYLKFVGLKYRLPSDSEMRKIENESANFIEWLISKGLDIDGESCFENSALHSAIRFNLQHILPTILKYTDFINHIDNGNVGGSLLHLFLRKNKCVRDSHEGKPSKSWYSNYTRRHAANIVRTMLDRGVDPEVVDINGDTTLHVAIQLKENIKIVKMLIAYSEDADQKNFIEKTPFYLALWKWAEERRSMEANYYLQILRALIDKGVDVSELATSRFTLLNKALEKKNLLLLEFLRENDAKDDRVGGHISLIRLLIDKWLQLRKSKEIEVLLKYWIKLDVANLKPIDNEDYEALTKIDEFQQFYMKCLDELRILKNTFIDNRMSLFKWLHRKPNSTCNLFSEQLRQVVHSPLLEEQFPEYAVLILASFHSATARKSLLERAKSVWWDLTKIELPDLCIEAILSHLSISELTDFTEKD